MVSAATYPLAIVLSAKDGVSGVLGRVETKLGSLGRKSTQVGKTLTKSLTLPISLLGAATIGASANFQKAMNNVAAITNTVGAPAFDQLRAKALELGSTTQFSASQAADGMGILAQAGLDANKILATMPTTLELAAAGDLELAQSADIATAILSSQREGTEMLDLRTNQLVKTSLAAKTTIGQLGEGFRQVGDASKGAGQTFETTLALLAGFADAGKRGSEGGVALRNTIARLLKPAGEAQKALAGLGIDKSQIVNADGSLRDLLEIFALLEKRGANATDLATIFGVESFAPVLAVTQKGTATLQEFAAGLDEVGVAGARAEYAAARMSGASGGIAGFWSAVEGLAIAVGDSGLLDWFTSATRAATAFARRLSESSPTALKWASIIGIAAAALGPFLMVVGQASTGVAGLIKVGRWLAPMLGTVASTLFGTVIPATVAWTAALLANPIFWIGAAIAGVTVGVIYLAKNWDKSVAAMKRGFNALMKPARAVLGWIDEKLGAIARFVVPPWMRWLIGLGGDDEEAASIAADGAVVVDQRAAAAAAGSTPLRSFSERHTTSRVHVDFDNLPRGARVTGDAGGDFDLDVGYAMDGEL